MASDRHVFALRASLVLQRELHDSGAGLHTRVSGIHTLSMFPEDTISVTRSSAITINSPTGVYCVPDTATPGLEPGVWIFCHPHLWFLFSLQGPLIPSP